MEGRAEPPSAAVTLGFKVRAVDPDQGTVEVAWTASDRFWSPAGFVQAGLLAAMPDDTMGPALVATLGRAQLALTADLHLQLLARKTPQPGTPRRAGEDRLARRSHRLPGR